MTDKALYYLELRPRSNNPLEDMGVLTFNIWDSSRRHDKGYIHPSAVIILDKQHNACSIDFLYIRQETGEFISFGSDYTKFFEIEKEPSVTHNNLKETTKALLYEHAVVATNLDALFDDLFIPK